MDGKAPISAKLYGSRYGFNGDKFKSDGGIFSPNNHPEIVIYNDRGFRFTLRRAVGIESVSESMITFELENPDADFALNRRYSLAREGESFACIEFSENGKTEELPSGGTVTEIINYYYRAVDGYIIFTKQEPYGDDYLFSGEFEFVGRTKDGDEIEVRNGKFSDCRICFRYDVGCNGY